MRLGTATAPAHSARGVHATPLRTSRASAMTPVTVMCRLFGFRSATSEHVHDALVTEQNSLRRQSLEHPDGWGIASWGESGFPEVARGLGAAHLDPEVRADQQRGPGTHGAGPPAPGLGGDRSAWTTPTPSSSSAGPSPTTGRCTPSPGIGAAIEALIAPRFAALMRGDTDSERCFTLFLARLAEVADADGRPSLEAVQWALATTMAEVARITDVDVGDGKRDRR